MRFLITGLFMVLAWSVVADPLLIKNVSLVSSQWQKTKPNRDVLIKNGRIVRIGTSIKADDAKQIEGQGRFLTPGLIDGHVHLGSYGGIRGDKVSQHRELVRAFRRQEPLSYLYYGFTTVVDLNQSDGFAKAWRKHRLAPALIHCIGLPYANGYGMAFEPEASRFNNPFFLLSEASTPSLPASVDPRIHTPRAVMDKVNNTQTDCVKTFHESGFSGLWDWPTPPDGMIQSVSRLAHQQKRLHFHHGNSLAAYRQAAVTDVDVLAHGLWHWQEHNGEQWLAKPIKAILKTLQQKGMAIQPTARVLGAELDVITQKPLRDPDLAHVLPEALIDFHRSGGSDWFVSRLTKIQQDNPDVVKRFLGRKPTGELGETTHAALKRLSLVLDYWQNIGGRLVFGSDSPSSPTYANPPGLNGYWELELLHRLGVPLKTLFDAVTLDNARLFGMENHIGVIKAGAKANLLLLNASPLETVKAYNQIDRVILDGVPYHREVFSAEQPQ